MGSVPDIVKELRIRERLGLFSCDSSVSSGDINILEKSDIKNIKDTTLFEYPREKNISNNSLDTMNYSTKIIECSRLLIEIFPEGIAIIDKNGKFLDANKKICKWLGYKNGDLKGKNFFDFPLSIGGNEIPIKKLFTIKNKKELTSSQEIKYINNYGKQLYGTLHANPVINTEKEVDGYILMISDITNIIKAEDEINKLKQFHENVIDNANIWLSVTDTQSNIKLWNKAAETITGYLREEVIGHNNIWMRLKPDKKILLNQKNFEYGDSKSNNMHSSSYENLIKRKNGEIRIISWNSQVIFDNFNNPIGNITLGQDITDQKKFEEKIKKQNIELNGLNKNLEEKVKDRTKQIKHLLDQKNDFISQLSHDLKTPLTPLMVLLPMLKDNIQNKNDKNKFDIIMRNVFYMKDLISKTIDLAKLNSDKISFSFEKINITNEIENIIKNNQIILEKNKIHIVNKIKIPINVKADKLRLDEVLNNLITNSIKYTSNKKGKIVINAVKKKNMVIISIKDSGIGMNTQQQKKIFDEYYKIDNSRHELDSSGLGLTITKKIIEKHGGKIWVESKGTGKGSTFFFNLKMV